MAYIGQAPAAAIAYTSDIANNAITSAKIADGTVVASDVNDGSITTAKLADSSVTAAKLGTVYAGNITGLGSFATVSTLYKANISDLETLGTIVTQDANDVSISGGNVYNVGLKVATATSSSNVLTLDYSAATVYKSTASENTTITPTNMPEQEGIMLLKLTNGGAYTISFAGNCAFISNTAPTLTASGTDYLFIQGNTTHYAVFTQLNVY